MCIRDSYDRDVLVVCDEPEKENSVNQLSEYFETIWNKEDSGYFHNNIKLANSISVKLSLIHIFCRSIRGHFTGHDKRTSY